MQKTVLFRKPRRQCAMPPRVLALKVGDALVFKARASTRAGGRSCVRLLFRGPPRRVGKRCRVTPSYARVRCRSRIALRIQWRGWLQK